MNAIYSWIFGACIIGLAWRVQSAPAPSARPNVLFIMADDLNDLLGCYDAPAMHTPNIDRLAQRGVRFQRAYCTFPLCGPSRNSLLTGLYPDRTGVLQNGPIFRETIPEQVSLPQAFRLAGYRAVRLGKMYHYGVPRCIGTDGNDDPASWEIEFNPAGVDRLLEESDIFSLRPGQFGGTLSWYASPRPDHLHTDGLLASEALWVLDRHTRPGEPPFFIGLGFFRPHTPYVAPRPYFDLYPVERMPVPKVSEETLARLPAAALATRRQEELAMSDDLRRQARQAYCASISFMDAQVGRVLDALDRLGLATNTIVVFTSDHGYHLGEYGLWQKMTLFERSARVPLILVAPGIARPGTVVTTPVSQVDLYPTLAELCGVRAPRNLQGQSLVPMLRDPTFAGRGWALTQVTRNRRRDGRRETYVGYSIRTARWRYTEWDEGREGRELYDHDTDPNEEHNRADDPTLQDTVRELAELLRKAVREALPPSGERPTPRAEPWYPMLTTNWD
jgi:iduronate 2-sulfatase